MPTPRGVDIVGLILLLWDCPMSCLSHPYPTIHRTSRDRGSSGHVEKPDMMDTVLLLVLTTVVGLCPMRALCDRRGINV